MTGFFQSGLAVDLILLVIAVEVLALWWWPHLRGRMQRADILSLSLPGVMLLLALRTALTEGPEIKTAAFLAAAFLFHLWDIARRRKTPHP